MSRIGRKPIAIPAGVEVAVNGNEVTVKGPKGTMTQTFNSDLTVTVENGEVLVTRPSDDKEPQKSARPDQNPDCQHGTRRFGRLHKELEIQGVGYRAVKQGKDLVMTLGFSHQVIMSEGNGITIDVPSPSKIVISGYDKQAVGQFAAEVRAKRPPEPYKGKGIRYVGEYVIRKEGKAGKGKK